MSRTSTGHFTKILAALSVVAAVAGADLAVTAQSASASPAAPAINTVACDRSEYVWVVGHGGLGNTTDNDECFANAGEMEVNALWVTRIWTGNNRVQYYADGSWQPAQAIGKNTTYNWPNNPGGVRVEKIRIL